MLSRMWGGSDPSRYQWSVSQWTERSVYSYYTHVFESFLTVWSCLNHGPSVTDSPCCCAPFSRLSVLGCRAGDSFMLVYLSLWDLFWADCLFWKIPYLCPHIIFRPGRSLCRLCKLTSFSYLICKVRGLMS